MEGVFYKPEILSLQFSSFADHCPTPCRETFHNAAYRKSKAIAQKRAMALLIHLEELTAASCKMHFSL